MNKARPVLSARCLYRATEVFVTLEWDPPAGGLGAAVAKILGDDPARQLKEDLWRFKQLMETGFVPTTQGQACGHAQAVKTDNGKEQDK